MALLPFLEMELQPLEDIFGFHPLPVIDDANQGKEDTALSHSLHRGSNLYRVNSLLTILIVQTKLAQAVFSFKQHVFLIFLPQAYLPLSMCYMASLDTLV